MHSREPVHAEIRRLLLHEMVARILKVSLYKILRQANGYGREESMMDAIKGQVDVEYKEVRTPFMPTDGAKRRMQREMNPSNEACRSALVGFFNVVFSRQYTETLPKSPQQIALTLSRSLSTSPRMPARSLPDVGPQLTRALWRVGRKQEPLRKQLEEQGMAYDDVQQVLTLAKLIADIKKSNRDKFPSAVEHTVVTLKKEMATIVRASMPGPELRACSLRLPGLTREWVGPGGALMLERYSESAKKKQQRKEEKKQREAEEQVARRALACRSAASNQTGGF